MALSPEVSSENQSRVNGLNGPEETLPIDSIRREHLAVLGSITKSFPDDLRVSSISESISDDGERTIVLDLFNNTISSKFLDIDKQTFTDSFEEHLRLGLSDVDFDLKGLDLGYESHEEENSGMRVAVRVKSEDPTPQFSNVPNSLVNEAIHGNREAFGRIYELTHNRIFRYLCGILYNATSQYTPELAEDLTQDTFERAWKARNTFVHFAKVPYEAYLFRIASNQAMSTLRRGKHKKSKVIFEALNTSYPDSSQTTRLGTGEELIMVGRLIKDIPVAQQQVMTLLLLGYKQKEIAYLLDKTVNNIKVLNYKGRVSLQDQKRRDLNSVSQMLVMAVADSIMRKRLYEGRQFDNVDKFRRSIQVSISHRTKAPDFDINMAIDSLPEGFLERLLSIGRSDWRKQEKLDSITS